MLHLSTIRQHFDSGFRSVVSLVEELEQQIEALTLANQSPNRFQHLEQTISNQQEEIKGLKFSASIRSYLSSVRKQGRGLLIALKSVLDGKPLTVNN